jgi:hypothetical protein
VEVRSCVKAAFDRPNVASTEAIEMADMQRLVEIAEPVGKKEQCLGLRQIVGRPAERIAVGWNCGDDARFLAGW